MDLTYLRKVLMVGFCVLVVADLNLLVVLFVFVGCVRVMFVFVGCSGDLTLLCLPLPYLLSVES
jgi:hypothetical protein